LKGCDLEIKMFIWNGFVDETFGQCDISPMWHFANVTFRQCDIWSPWQHYTCSTVSQVNMKFRLHDNFLGRLSKYVQITHG
jgi:hypothetical protein